MIGHWINQIEQRTSYISYHGTEMELLKVLLLRSDRLQIVSQIGVPFSYLSSMTLEPTYNLQKTIKFITWMNIPKMIHSIQITI